MISSYAGVNCTWALLFWVVGPIWSFTAGSVEDTSTENWLFWLLLYGGISHALVATLGGLLAFLGALFAFGTIGWRIHRLQRHFKLLGPISFTVVGVLLGVYIWGIGSLSGLTQMLVPMMRADIMFLPTGALTGFFFWYFQRRALAKLTPVHE